MLFKKRSCYIDQECEIISSKLIAKNTFEIKILLKNNDYRISQFIPGFYWMGKHFALTSKKLQKSRLYSVCLCLNSEILIAQERLMNNISLLENNQNINELPENFTQNIKYIEIYVKRYNYKDALSNYINSENNIQDLKIKGPIVINTFEFRV